MTAIPLKPLAQAAVSNAEKKITQQILMKNIKGLDTCTISKNVTMEQSGRI
jgi:hypothetical protein